MIEKIEVFKAVCDKCGESFNVDGMELHFDSVEQTKNEVCEDGWNNIKNTCKVYCPVCKS